MSKLYIFIGIAIITIYSLVFRFTGKLPIYPFRKYTNKSGVYNRLLVLLHKLTMRFISTGIYYKIPYQLHYYPINVAGNAYYVFGNIGKIGYYSDARIIKGKEVQIYFVLWKKLDMENLEIVVQYPSGKKEVWNAKITSIQHDIETSKIRGIYQVSPYTFKEEGKVQVTISNDKEKEATFFIKVNN